MAKNRIKKQYLNGYERILKIDYMISHMHWLDMARLADGVLNNNINNY